MYIYIYIYTHIYIYRLIPEKTAECSEMVGVSVSQSFWGPLSDTSSRTNACITEAVRLHRHLASHGLQGVLSTSGIIKHGWKIFQKWGFNGGMIFLDFFR